MGCLVKSKDSKFWRASFYVGGKKVFRSTGVEDKRAARAIMETWEDAAGGRVSGTQARKVLAEILGKGERRVSVGEFARQWVAERKGEVKPETWGFYSKAVNSWLGGLGAGVVDGPMDELSRRHLSEWRAGEAVTLSTATVNHHVKVVRMVLRAAVGAGWLRENPLEGLRPLKATQAEREEVSRRPFTREELDRVLAAAGGEWRGLVLLGLYTGQRLGDLAALRVGDFREGSIFIDSTLKTGARICVPLPPAVVAEFGRMESVRTRGEWLFPESRATVERAGGKVLRLSRQFRQILAEVGLAEAEKWIPAKEREARRAAEGGADRRRKAGALTFHSLRHNTRTWLEESGAPVAVIDALMGQDARTGRRSYTHVGQDSLAKAAAGLAARMDGQS